MCFLALQCLSFTFSFRISKFVCICVAYFVSVFSCVVFSLQQDQCLCWGMKRKTSTYLGMQESVVKVEMGCNVICNFMGNSVEIWHFWSAGIPYQCLKALGQPIVGTLFVSISSPTWELTFICRTKHNISVLALL